MATGELAGRVALVTGGSRGWRSRAACWNANSAVSCASPRSRRPRPLQMPYGVSKAAVIAFARSCSEAFAPEVRINTIAPGLIETEMAGKLSPNARRAMIEGTPMKRIGEPEEIAEMALFLLSERSSFTTGQCFVASGGRVTLP